MEFGHEHQEDHTHPPILLPDNNIKSEITYDDFSTENLSSKSMIQNLDHFDHFSFAGQSSFDSFTYSSCSNDPDIYDFESFATSGDNGNCANLYNFHQAPMDFSMSKCSLMPLSWQDEIKPLNLGIPNEGSCVPGLMDIIGYCEKNEVTKKNNSASTKKDRKSRKMFNSSKGQWTIAEDSSRASTVLRYFTFKGSMKFGVRSRILKQLVEKFGVSKWSHIAQTIKGKNGKQCRERWHNHLRPHIKKDVWSEEEDKILIEVHAKVGNKWSEIAKKLPGRTENSIKNHWNATKRRQCSKRKCKSKWPAPSPLLQNYIRSLNLDAKSSTNIENADSGYVLVKEPVWAEPTEERLVLDYDFNEVMDFDFDAEKLLEGDSNVNNTFYGKNFDVEEMKCCDVDSFMLSEVKEELDLFEMISQLDV